MPNNKNTPAIPEKIRKEYRIVSLLSLHENAFVFSLEKKKLSSQKTEYLVHSNPSQGVMKIMPSSYFDDTLFTALQSLHHPLLLLPTELIAEGNFVYALYPRLLPFSEFLSKGKISLSAILQWIKDMSQVLSCLHEKNIFHGDIAPSNIYLDDEGHFYLGDFSSGRILSPRQTMAYKNNKKKTAATFPSSFSMTDCRQDIYSFLTILSKLLEASTPAAEDGNAVLSALRDRTDAVLLELKEQKRFHLSFRQVCQNILSVMEENPNEINSPHHDFILSAKKLDFLKETTKTLKKSSISSLSPLQLKRVIPVFSLAICTLVLLSAIIFYAGTGNSQHKGRSLPTTELIQKKYREGNPHHSSPLPTTSNNAMIAPTGNNDSVIVPTAKAVATGTPVPGNLDYTILDISCKKYHSIPSSPRTDSSVKIIFAQGNRLKKLSSFSDYSALEELYLDGNVISDLSDLSGFQRLAILGLSNNQVTDLSSLGDISSLRILDLSGHAKLSNISSLAKLKKLEYLILTDTNASDDDIQCLQQSLPRCTILH